MSEGQDAQQALDTFGFLVIAYTHEEDAVEDERVGFTDEVSWKGRPGRLVTKVIGRATREDWNRQHELWGDSPAVGFRSFLKVIAE